MSSGDDALRARIAAMPDEELLKIVTLAVGKFATPTMILARNELVRRGHPGFQLSEETAPQPRSIAEAGGVRYGGFWRRFGAFWIDALLVVPYAALGLWVQSITRYANFWLLLPSVAFAVWYQVYLVKRFAGTPGKIAMSLRIQRVDGGPVGYREAFLRQAVVLVLSQAMGIAFGIASMGMSDDAYFALGWLARSQQILTLAPWWFRPVKVFLDLWNWSEFIVMMTNRKRRALHDFMAGTVVVHEPRRDTLPEPVVPPAVASA